MTHSVWRTGGATNTAKTNTVEALRILASNSGRKEYVPILGIGIPSFVCTYEQGAYLLVFFRGATWHLIYFDNVWCQNGAKSFQCSVLYINPEKDRYALDSPEGFVVPSGSRR